MIHMDLAETGTVKPATEATVSATAAMAVPARFYEDGIIWRT